VGIFLKRNIVAILLVLTILICNNPYIQRAEANQPDMIAVNGENSTDLGIQSKAAILMEASTGKILYENNADEIVSPASITKIMTLILIFDAINEGKIDYDDVVTTSEYAKSMGGSQVFLETGEKQTVETLVKCIVVASGNDASVCMAEYIAGSETEFVRMMNERARELGMTNTVFKDCCGLCDSMEHHTSARDVAIMSRELITKYPEIHNYSKIWMENITHVTNKGSIEFTLANTNKLLKQYEWATGLKTGSTSLAKYCLSATACKDNIELIAVIMGAPDYKVRFSEAVTLLNYGYSVVSMYSDKNDEINREIKISGGVKKTVKIEPEKEFVYICGKDEVINNITKKVKLEKKVKAPAKSGSVVGKTEYYIGDNMIGEVNICLIENVRKAGYVDYLKKMWYKYIM
jgi:D-alanyl-D-alanine carboxypeptidase (penicillin-binding protein 5/6)